MLLKASSTLLVLWGLINAVGGGMGAWAHPGPWIGVLFVSAGVLIVAGGLGLLLQRSWGLSISLTGVVALSIVALVSAVSLRGTAGMRLSHHLTRLAISGGLLLAAWFGTSAARRRSRRSSGSSG